MAVSIAQFPALVSTLKFSPSLPKPTAILSRQAPKFSQFASNPRKFTSIPKTSDDDENSTTTGGEEESSNEMTELGRAMKEREEKETGFVSGVVEEVREIEWPAFNKVLGTTGVVLGVIAGSSVVLLTVNAVLAQISDTTFARKGVQDFFG